MVGGRNTRAKSSAPLLVACHYDVSARSTALFYSVVRPISYLQLLTTNHRTAAQRSFLRVASVPSFLASSNDTTLPLSLVHVLHPTHGLTTLGVPGHKPSLLRASFGRTARIDP